MGISWPKAAGANAADVIAVMQASRQANRRMDAETDKAGAPSVALSLH
jgi:hypothetical protein